MAREGRARSPAATHSMDRTRKKPSTQQARRVTGWRSGFRVETLIPKRHVPAGVFPESGRDDTQRETVRGTSLREKGGIVCRRSDDDGGDSREETQGAERRSRYRNHALDRLSTELTRVCRTGLTHRPIVSVALARPVKGSGCFRRAGRRRLRTLLPAEIGAENRVGIGIGNPALR